MPSLSRAAARPAFTHGLQSGDVAHDGAVVWTRADRPAYMRVEWATTESFADPRALPRLGLTEATDFTGKMTLRGLPSDQDIFWRVTLEDPMETGAVSEPLVGASAPPPPPPAT